VGHRSACRSAAAALRQAGAASVAIVPIGRFLTPSHHDNAARLRALPPWSVNHCAATTCHAAQHESERAA
jgi:hypothetical protein